MFAAAAGITAPWLGGGADGDCVDFLFWKTMQMQGSTFWNTFLFSGTVPPEIAVLSLGLRQMNSGLLGTAFWLWSKAIYSNLQVLPSAVWFSQPQMHLGIAEHPVPAG